MEFKAVLCNPKTGKSYQKEIKEPNSRQFVGMKIGDKVKGEVLDLPGYEFEITGGSDYCGFPMRKDADGTGRKKILTVSGVGVRKVAKGMRQKKTVAGNTIFARTAQINMKVLKEGSMSLGVDKEVKAEAVQGKEEKPAAHPEQKPENVEKAEQKPAVKEEKKPKKEHKAEEEKKAGKSEPREEPKAEKPKKAEKKEEKEEKKEEKKQ